MLLIYPPAVRAAEPPLGAARLAALLRSRGVRAAALDLCAEGLRDLLRADASAAEAAADDTWTRLALRRRERCAELLSGPAGYGNFGRYSRAVADLERALGAVSRSRSPGASASLADYRDDTRSPLRRADLLAAAADFERNPFFPFFSARIEAALAELRTELVGLSVNYLSQALCAFAVAGWLSRAHPETKIVLGGGLITSWLSQGRLAAGDDFGGLFSAVAGGDGAELLLALHGLGPGGEAPAPDFSDFGGVRYFSPGPILPYNFSFGCPWRRCTFCPEKAEGAAYRGVSVSAAGAQIRELVSRGAPALLHFTDNEIGPAYLRALAASPPGAPWYGFARFSRDLASAEFCRALAASGCRMLQLGLESGDQAVLDALDKGTRLEEIERILFNLKEAGIAVYAYLLFGTPAEDRDAAARTRDFVAAHAAQIDFLNVAVFNLPASSPEAAGLKTRAFYEGDLSLYAEFEHPAGWNRAEVRAFLSREFEAEPAIRAVLRRTPPVFTSSHAPFFVQR